MSNIYLLRSNTTNNYLSSSFKKNKRVYTRFLKYAVWFETKSTAEKHRLKKSERIEKCVKWWNRWENKEYKKNRRSA